MSKNCIKCKKKIHLFEAHNKDEKGRSLCINCTLKKDVKNEPEVGEYINIKKPEGPYHDRWIVRASSIVALISGITLGQHFWGIIGAAVVGGLAGGLTAGLLYMILYMIQGKKYEKLMIGISVLLVSIIILTGVFFIYSILWI